MRPIPEIEQEILKFWNEQRIFQKSLEKPSPKGEYVFYDGPPFATGLPHYGHILGSTVKDLIGRYWTMKGYHVARRWGWDCHGLPIENIVEKELKINSKKEIEKLGVGVFNEACRNQVLTYVHEWGKTVERIGRWVDFENSYKTMDNSYIESVWWAFKEIWKKGLVYEGKKVLLNCPRCETPIAKAEVAMDNSYKDVTEDSVYVSFHSPKAGELFGTGDETYFLAWTTTPWTLPGNVALAVGESIEYVLVKQNKRHYLLAKDRLGFMSGECEVLKEMKGKEFEGIAYEPLYSISDIAQSGKRSHYVALADFVSTEEGTGIVHTAVVYGEDDYNLGLQLDLPMVPLLDIKAIFNEKAPGFLHGIYFKDADRMVIEDLSKRGILYKSEQNIHSYPYCHRCDTPLFYNAIDSWFINIQKMKERLLQLNSNLNWFPKHFKDGRFKKSVEAAPDWNLSRNRYWASAIPVWECTSRECSHQEVIGSVQELREKATNAPAGEIDLHKHVVDAIELKCTKCQGTMRRIPEVIDCWFESASMPFAAVHYPFENKEWFERNFPAQFIVEYTGQVRTWFYYMLVVSACLFDSIPFENVVVTGVILAEDGSKMSKSRKNYPDPWKMFDQYGVDVLRYYLMSSNVMSAEDVNFSEQSVKDVSNRVFGTLMNVARFYALFAEGKSVGGADQDDLNNILDQWITAKLNVLTRAVTQRLDANDIPEATREIGEFINELSVWYVRRSRDRFKSSDPSVVLPALKILRRTLICLVKLLAPICPFIPDYIYRQELGAEGSVHLESWPEPPFEDVIEGERVISTMDQVRAIVSLALEQRASNGVPVRQPLQRLRIATPPITSRGDKGGVIGEEYIQLIKDEVNVKEVEVSEGSGELSVELDMTISEELKKEGLVREITRLVNDLRKKQGLTIQDRVTVLYQGDAGVELVIEQYRDQLAKATLAKEWKSGTYDSQLSLKLKDHELQVAFKK